ncbi:MAG: GNAT family N-acetyltransferase [Bacteroidales bacterium]|nr:GNAT family N-acetyltransferase [Bacteroidales bacterium]
MIIRKAACSDLGALMKIFEGAKQIMRDSGNIHQWNGAYPTEDVVMNDIESGNCYVLCDDEAILGTMALIPGPDPTYSYIEGEWPDDAPYYVIHRIATAAPGKNVAIKLFDWAFGHIASQGCKVIRIDTHEENKIMKHILGKYGFMMCGLIYLKDGAPRDAYHLSR